MTDHAGVEIQMRCLNCAHHELDVVNPGAVSTREAKMVLKCRRCNNEHLLTVFLETFDANRWRVGAGPQSTGCSPSAGRTDVR